MQEVFSVFSPDGGPEHPRFSQ